LDATSNYITNAFWLIFHVDITKYTQFRDHDTIAPCSNAERLVRATGLHFRPCQIHSICNITKGPRLLCLGLLFVTELRLLLGNHSLLLSFTGSLGLRTLGIHLLLQDSLTRLLSLGLVNLSTSSAPDTEHTHQIYLHAQPKLSCA
jgi:hypothetical protein